MGPSKKAKGVQNLTMEAQIADIASKLDMICGKLHKIDTIESKLVLVETALSELKHENSFIREELAAARSVINKKDEIISNLSNLVNRLDQNARANSVRILGLPVTQQTPRAEVEKIVFDLVVNPCVEAAKKEGDLPASVVPFPSLLIDSAFVTPSKNNSSAPVIVKFSNQTTRNLLFRYKKSALPQVKDPAIGRMRSKYSIFEDLSPSNFSLLQLFSKDSRVRSAWTYNGQVRFKTLDSEQMYRVKSPLDTFESITKKSNPRSPASPNPLMVT
jgi:hypothetical protein